MTIATIEIRILFEMYFVYFLKDYSKSTVQISIYIKSCTEIFIRVVDVAKHIGLGISLSDRKNTILIDLVDRDGILNTSGNLEFFFILSFEFT